MLLSLRNSVDEYLATVAARAGNTARSVWHRVLAAAMGKGL